jgi:hypothetical protein
MNAPNQNNEPTTTVDNGQPAAVDVSTTVTDSTNTETVVDDAGEASQDQGQAPKKKHPVQARIDQLTRDKYERDARIAALEAEVAASKQVSGQRNDTTQQQASDNAPPKPADFEDVTEYVNAAAAFQARQIVKQQTEQIQKQQQQQSEQQRFAMQAHKLRTEGQAEDFDFVIQASARMVPPIVQQAVLASENSAVLAYHIGKNPDIAFKLATIQNPYSMMIEIGKIEAQITTKTAPRTPAAPPPINPVNGGSGPQAVDMTKMSAQQWIDYQKKNRK